MADVQTNKKIWEKSYTIEAYKTEADFKHADKNTIEELLEFDKEQEERKEKQQEALGTWDRSISKALKTC
ncbi:MAG: hypothetical protein IJJ13_10370 [Lachnospiraceae bacterium]|nr:hypothetical protein [Lachnospiraceae bacterium]